MSILVECGATALDHPSMAKARTVEDAAIRSIDRKLRTERARREIKTALDVVQKEISDVRNRDKLPELIARRDRLRVEYRAAGAR